MHMSHAVWEKFALQHELVMMSFLIAFRVYKARSTAIPEKSIKQTH